VRSVIEASYVWRPLVAFQRISLVFTELPIDEAPFVDCLAVLVPDISRKIALPQPAKGSFLNGVTQPASDVVSALKALIADGSIRSGLWMPGKRGCTFVLDAADVTDTRYDSIEIYACWRCT
jgi:hypothetical protein